MHLAEGEGEGEGDVHDVHEAMNDERDKVIEVEVVLLAEGSSTA